MTVLAFRILSLDAFVRAFAAFIAFFAAAISFLAARKTALAFEAAISSAVRLASIPFSRRSSTRAALRFRRERFLASLASALACASFFRA